jgi:MFS superfamily sulfate permease-like transporter
VTAVVAGFLISAIGGSRVQIGGPTGAFIVVVFSVIAEHGMGGLLSATFMAGVILIVAGYLRAGRLMRIIPEAVIEGFTIGIALIIAASQLQMVFGLDAGEVPAEFLPKLAALWEARATFSLPAALIALATVVLIVTFRRLFPRLPGLIVAVGLTSAAVVVLALPSVLRVVFDDEVRFHHHRIGHVAQARGAHEGRGHLGMVGLDVIGHVTLGQLRRPRARRPSAWTSRAPRSRRLPSRGRTGCSRACRSP